MFRRALAWLTLLSLCLVRPTPVAWAQTRPAEPKSYSLKLEKPDTLPAGQFAGAHGTSSADGHRFSLSRVSILQPVDLVVATLDERDDVDVVLGRDRWDERIKTSTTNDRGVSIFRLRTEGDIRITVKARNQPAHYLLMAFVGDEVKPPMQRKILTASAPPSSGNWGWSAAGIAGLGGIVVVGAILLVVRGRRRSIRNAAIIVLLSGTAVVAFAQDPSPAGASGSGPFRAAWDTVRNPDSSYNRAARRAEEEFGTFDSASRPFNIVNGALNLGYNAWDAWQAHENFTPEDEGYLPDLNPEGMPGLPVGCPVDQEAACRACYERAQSRLHGQMLLLERLRALYESTKRYNDAMVSFGDNTSGIHGALGLAWQAQKRDILATFAKFERTHEDKRQGMMRSLRTILDEIAACEAQYFNNPDWFTRYGFIYYQFMDARYKR